MRNHSSSSTRGLVLAVSRIHPFIFCTAVSATRRHPAKASSDSPAPPGLWILHTSRQTFILTVRRLRATWSYAAEGSAKILLGVMPKVRESGKWARLKGCNCYGSRVTSVACSFTSGLRTSNRAKTTPFSRQSITFPSSTITLASTATRHANLPETILSDSGSNAREPTTTVSKSLVAYADNFLFSS